MLQTPILKLENIFYSYPSGELALKNINVEIFQGERIAILGQNGAGKSTFFLACNGILTAEKGELYYLGNKIKGNKQELFALRENIGIVFQDAENQIIATTVEGEVSFGPINLGFSKEKVLARVDNALSQMGLTQYKTRAPQYLSGGEKKRVTIADILAMEPKVILLDEPTASLDYKNTIMLEETLNNLANAGITIIISTHDIDFAYRFAKRGIVFSDGEIIADNQIEEIFSNKELLTKAKLPQPFLMQLADKIKEINGENSLLIDHKNLESFAQSIAKLL